MLNLVGKEGNFDDNRVFVWFKVLFFRDCLLIVVEKLVVLEWRN